MGIAWSECENLKLAVKKYGPISSVTALPYQPIVNQYVNTKGTLIQQIILLGRSSLKASKQQGVSEYMYISTILCHYFNDCLIESIEHVNGIIK